MKCIFPSIILDKNLLILLVNIKMFYLLKIVNSFMSAVFYFIGLIFYSFYGFVSTNKFVI